MIVTNYYLITLALIFVFVKIIVSFLTYGQKKGGGIEVNHAWLIDYCDMDM